MPIILLIIGLLMFFGLGVASTLLIQVIPKKFIHKEKEITLKTRDVFWARFQWWVSFILVVFGFFYIAGPTGWIWQDFMHYADKVVCIPKGWGATFYPMGKLYDFRIEYFDNTTVVYKEDNSTLLNMSELPDWFAVPQQPPYKPEDKLYEGLYD